MSWSNLTDGGLGGEHAKNNWLQREHYLSNIGVL